MFESVFASLARRLAQAPPEGLHLSPDHVPQAALSTGGAGAPRRGTS
jgi:hypothetical protein